VVVVDLTKKLTQHFLAAKIDATLFLALVALAQIKNWR